MKIGIIKKIIFNAEFIISGFGCVLTSNGKYVIIIGRYGSNKTFVMNVETMEFTESKIIASYAKPCYAVILGVGDAYVLVNVFIRILCEKNEFKNIAYPIPDLIRLICLFYDDEYVYVIYRDIPRGLCAGYKKRMAVNTLLSNVHDS